MSSTAPERPHIPALDAVRGLAILMVTAFRFTRAPNDLQPLIFGERGVDLFFVLSGFLITGILLSSREQPHYFRNFYMRRVLRIFPLYYGTLILVFGVLPLFGRTHFSAIAPYQGWLWLYGTNILVTHQNAWMLDGFNHFWSLAVEEHFYFVWPLIIYVCSPRTSLKICVAMMVAALGLRSWLAWHGGEVAAEGLTPCRMDALAIGALVAIGTHLWGVRALVPWAIGAAGAAVLGLVAVRGWDQSVYSVRYSLYALLCAALIVSAVTAAPNGLAARVWNNRVLRFFGKYSYALYVFQGPLAAVAEDWVPTAVFVNLVGGSLLGGKLLFMLFWSTVTLAAALVSWHLYEKQFLKLKRYFDHAAAPPAASAGEPAPRQRSGSGR
jgi:peptidoglycan/LPS O-acetylase OafA/YrhL